MILNYSRFLPRKELKRIFGSGALFLVSVFLFACQPPETDDANSPGLSQSANITPTPNVTLTEFESELKSMRIADFYYVFTLKRKDGRAFDSEDKRFVRENKHYAANRFSFIENETILFIGSNYEFTEENLMALRERFEFQDFSKPKEQIEKEKADKKAEREKKEEDAQNSNTNVQNLPEKSAN
jgi:hypothetical protein